jgi:hypothetical protein
MLLSKCPTNQTLITRQHWSGPWISSANLAYIGLAAYFTTISSSDNSYHKYSL